LHFFLPLVNDFSDFIIVPVLTALDIIYVFIIIVIIIIVYYANMAAQRDLR